MEMHQIRYFLAVTRTLNFTRAADECNVTQPSLTRAIKQLEAELGGDLFRRERPAAQLTELGQRMQPLLKQCYEAAVGARSLATSFKGGKIGCLRIAIADAVDLALLIPHLEQLKRLFSNLEFKLMRGNSRQVGEYLKKGDAELGIAVEISKEWDRLDSWPLFTEGFQLVVNGRHPLAAQDQVAFDDLKAQPLLSRGYCEYAERLNTALRSSGVSAGTGHDVSSECDLIKLLEADIGIAIVPCSATMPGTLRHAAIDGLDIRRTVQLFGVAGRERTAVASAAIKLLRSANWAFESPAQARARDPRPALAIVAA
ncbi:MAG: LysR family transcriptional regulator [bacterium]|nr:LysR family transcriptional regulator [bacterium]